MTTLGLWLLVGMCAAGMVYFYLLLPKRFAQHGLRGVVFLRRVHFIDALLMMTVIGAGLLYAQQTKQPLAQQSALFLLLAMVYVHGMRYPRWLIYHDGFLAVGRFYSFTQLEAMQLSEDGVLQLQLKDRAPLLLPVLNMAELEKALWLLSDGAAGKLPKA